MAKQLISKIQLRRDTAANWSTNNTVLSKGEIALSYDEDENGVAILSTYRIKIGRGNLAWNDLDFFAQRILNGAGKPADSLGEDNQFYVDTANKYLYYKNKTVWILIGGDLSSKLDKNETEDYSVYGVGSTGDQVMYPITGGYGQIVGVEVGGKIPIGLLPDVVLGNVLYGGNLDGTPTDNSTWTAAISASLKTRLGLASAVSSITLKNQEGGTSTIGYGWKALEGVYFIANAKGTFAGIDFEVGDWLISTGSAWKKVDNTDAIKGVTGNIKITDGIIDTLQEPIFSTIKLGTTSMGSTIRNSVSGNYYYDLPYYNGSASTLHLLSKETTHAGTGIILSSDGGSDLKISTNFDPSGFLTGGDITGTENQIQITNGKIGLTPTTVTDIFKTNNLEVANKGTQFSQMAQNGIMQANTTGGTMEYSLFNYQALMHGKMDADSGVTTGGYSVIILPPVPASGSNQFAMPEVNNIDGSRIVVDLVGAQTNNKFTGKNAFTEAIIFGPDASLTGAPNAASIERRDDGKIYLGNGAVSSGDPSTGTYYTFSKNDEGVHEVATVEDIDDAISVAITGKQDELIPGNNITIENNLIDTVTDPTFSSSVTVGSTSGSNVVITPSTIGINSGSTNAARMGAGVIYLYNTRIQGERNGSLNIYASGGTTINGGRVAIGNGADISGTLTVTGSATFSTGVTIGDNLTIDNSKGVKFIGTDSLGAEHYYGTIVPNAGASGNPQFTLPQTGGQLARVEDITGAITGKQDKLTAGRNIEITTGATIQTKTALDATQIYNSTGNLMVGDGTDSVNIRASGIYLSGTEIGATGTIKAYTSISTKSNNTGSTGLKEVIVDTDYVIIDGGTSTTTW